MNQRGFTLVEVLIAVGISTVLIAGAMTIHVQNLRFYKSTESRSTLYQDSLLLIEFLRSEVMAAGGSSVRAWMGIWVEDNCGARPPLPACNGSDRLTVSSVSIPLQECAVTGQVSANPFVLQMAWAGPGVCCLQPQGGTQEVSFLGKQVMVTLSDNYIQRYANVVDLATCRITLVPGQASGNDSPGAVANWGGGVVAMVNVETFYFNPANRLLNRFVDANNDGLVQADEDVTVADNIFDLQIALGYDLNVADGNVLETANGINDEWLYNAPTLVESWAVAPFVAPNTRSQLQMVQISALMGTDNSTSIAAAAPVRALNGPLRSQAGWYLMEESARLSPRNSYIFQ